MTPHNYYTMDKLPCKDKLLDLCIVNHNTSNYNAYKLNRRRFNLKIIFSERLSCKEYLGTGVTINEHYSLFYKMYA